MLRCWVCISFNNSSRKNILGVFVGHQHNNDFKVDYFGMELHFGRKTGVSNYGPLL